MKAGRFLLHEGTAAGSVSTGPGLQGEAGAPHGAAGTCPAVGHGLFKGLWKKGENQQREHRPGDKPEQPKLPLSPIRGHPDPCTDPWAGTHHQDVASGVCAWRLRPRLHSPYVHLGLGTRTEALCVALGGKQGSWWLLLPRWERPGLGGCVRLPARYC